MKTQHKSTTRRKWWSVLLVGALLAGAAWFYLDHDAVLSMTRGDAPATLTESAASLPSAPLPLLTADGYLAPAQEAVLSLAASNTVGAWLRDKATMGSSATSASGTPGLGANRCNAGRTRLKFSLCTACLARLSFCGLT